MSALPSASAPSLSSVTAQLAAAHAPFTGPVDPLALAADLIRCPSVTPEDAGAMAVLEAALAPLGFVCHRVRLAEAGTVPVENLYARLGTEGPVLGFAGHTDVVPPGALESWSVPPFAGTVSGGRLFGRGAADMKGAIAAWIAAVARHLDEFGPPRGWSLALVITGDEEGLSINGTRPLLAWMQERGESLNACVVGEPTNPHRLGSMMKIGRRGSLNATVTVQGVQGHSAYPHLADNPLPRLARMALALSDPPLDAGSAHFDPSTLALTSIDTGNPTVNVIPGQACARFNVRFNDLHTPASLEAELRRRLDAAAGPEGAGRYTLSLAVSGVSFLTPLGPLSAALSQACVAVLGEAPEASTSGGTSDARFIKDVCPVIEFGLVGESMHKSDENVRLGDLYALTRIYARLLAQTAQGCCPW